MKKIIVLLLMCCLLGGCGQGETQSAQGSVQESTESNIDVAKEYTFSKLKEVSEQFWDNWIEETSKLSDVEWRGTSDKQEDMDEHFFKVSNKYVDKIMEDCEIPQNQKVIVSGYISKPTESSSEGIFVKNGAGKIFFYLKHNAEDDTYDGISCRTDDSEFLKLEENTPIKIEGVFIKQGVAASENVLYDCKIIESGEPESVSETKEPFVTPAFK